MTFDKSKSYCIHCGDVGACNKTTSDEEKQGYRCDDCFEKYLRRGLNRFNRKNQGYKTVKVNIIK